MSEGRAERGEGETRGRKKREVQRLEGSVWMREGKMEREWQRENSGDGKKKEKGQRKMENGNWRWIE